MGHPEFGGVEEVAVELAGEGAGDGLAESEGEEAGADGGLFCGYGVGDDREWRGDGVGEAVVAVDAGYLFDDIDLALEIEAPAEGSLQRGDVESVEDVSSQPSARR